MSKLLNIIFCCKDNKSIKEDYIEENEEISKNIADNSLQINNDDKNNKNSDETCNTNNNVNNKQNNKKNTYTITLNLESSISKPKEIPPPVQIQKEEIYNLLTANNTNKDQNDKINNNNSNNFKNNFFFNNNIIKPKLILSGELFYNKQVTLESTGLKSNSRKNNNSASLSPANNIVITSFGIGTNNNKKNCSASKLSFCINDYTLNFKFNQNNSENNFSNNDNNTISYSGRIFEIRYDKILRKFTLYFLHDFLILYYKLSNNNVFINYNKDYYFIIGDVVLTLLSKKINNKREIIVQVEVENSKTRKYSFLQSNTPIKIGRVNSHIIINQPSISKIHGIIDFSKEVSKFYYKDMGSTNGSTLLIKGDDDIPLHGEMNFKLEEVPFKIQEII